MKMRTEALKKKAKLTLKLIYTRQKPTQEKPGSTDRQTKIKIENKLSRDTNKKVKLKVK